MNALYNVVDVIETELESHPFVNTVTYGNIFDVNLNKQDIFPLSHFIVNNAVYGGSIWTLNISLLCMAIYDSDDNEHHVLAEQLTVINKILEVLRRGDLRDERYHLTGTPTASPFKERFEADLLGWEVTFDIQVPNTMGND